MKAPNAEEKKAQAERAEQDRLLTAARRLLAVKKARESLISFTSVTMPHPEDPDDPTRSRYEPVRHHETIAAALEEVEKGHWQRLIISMPPRHGKSELASRRFPAWFLGRDPYRQVLFATYNAELAESFGRNVREVMRLPAFQQVFPLCKLRQGSASANRIETEEGGLGQFVGVGGGLTGKGADLLIIDDPIKGREEADSQSARDKLWSWFTQEAFSRLMPGGRVVIIMTRWHEDDLIGRLTDERNPCYREELAAKWKILSLPAIAVDNDPMGRQPGDALWPERFGLEFLREAKLQDPKGFSALYQGQPTPEDGDYFKKDWLKGYLPHDLPQNLRTYCVSDHAVSTAQTADRTCLLPFGVDEQDNVWILPDVWWRRASTDQVVDGMIDLMVRRNPVKWGAERGHISQSIGPFLRKVQQERQVWTMVDEITPVKDKQTRAQAIRGRMAMGKVYFPKFAGWWGDAEQELLKFPSARHDDFVDALGLAGLLLSTLHGASRPPDKIPDGPKPGTLAWVKLSSKWEDTRRNLLQMGGF